MMRVCVLIVITAVGAASAVLEDTLVVPTFGLNDLSDSNNSEFAHTLATSGILAIRVEDEETTLSHHRQIGLGGLCQCYDRPEFQELDGADSIRIRNGETIRTTLATATIGSQHPLELPKEQLEQVCGLDTVRSLDGLRDYVALASQSFLRTLDNHLLTRGAAAFNEPILSTRDGQEFTNVRAIVDSSRNLEHFHVYEKEQTGIKVSPPTLDFHTDAGLFLAFVPGLTCNGGDESPDHSLLIKDHIDGTSKRVVFDDPDNTVIIMLGAGAQNWLRTGTQLTATTHSVRMEPGQVRAWYGMMHLVPQDAIVQETPRQQTFADMRKALVLTSQRATTREYGDYREDAEEDLITIGCGGTQEEGGPSSNGISTSLSRRRRRLQHVDDASVCNNSTNFYCWMTCLDIPKAQGALEYAAQGYSLYCAEPSVVNGGGSIGAAVDKCTEDGVAGKAMNSNCVGLWHSSTDGVPSQAVKLHHGAADEQAPGEGAPFCYGGTSMYMDGFNWIGSTCAIYLFPNWILSTPGKLAVACIGTIFFGILLEWVIARRRAVMKAIDGDGTTWYYRLIVSSSFYGLQLTIGYALMLVVMIYSGPLFLSVVIGLVGGHLLFNAKDALWGKGFSKKSEKKAQQGKDNWCDSNSPSHKNDSGFEAGVSTTEFFDGSCCTGDRDDPMEQPKSMHGSCCQEKEEDKEDDNAWVPEGSTPCCQNTL